MQQIIASNVFSIYNGLAPKYMHTYFEFMSFRLYDRVILRSLVHVIIFQGFKSYFLVNVFFILMITLLNY